MTALPTSLLVLLGTGPVLWVAFCVLKAQFGLHCGWACTATILIVDAAAIAWLVLQGSQVMNGAQFVFACVCLVTVNFGLLMGWLVGHLSRKRQREKQTTARCDG